MQFGGEIDDRIDIGDEGAHEGRIRDVALDEAEAPGLLGVVADRTEVREVAGVRQLVEDDDLGAVPACQHVPDVARADETSTTGDQEPAIAVRVGHLAQTGRVAGAARRPASSSSRASSAARSSDGTVPASVQWPS